MTMSFVVCHESQRTYNATVAIFFAECAETFSPHILDTSPREIPFHESFDVQSTGLSQIYGRILQICACSVYPI